MPHGRTSSALVLLIVIGLAGYLLVTLPPVVIEQYERAAALGPAWGYTYLATVGLGAILLVGLVVWMTTRVLVNTWRKSRTSDRRRRDPSEMSQRQRQAELAENIASSHEFTTDADVSPEVREAIRQRVAELEAKRASQKLEIVAYGTISSGKSSLLNALAGRDVFASDVRGGTTQQRSEVPWPGHDRVVLCDSPGLAEVRGQSRGAAAAEAARDADLVLLVVDGPLKAYEADMLERLTDMEKRVIVCLNKEDWLDDQERRDLIGQLVEQVAPRVSAADVVAVAARPAARQRVRILPDGSEAVEQVPARADIEPLARRMMDVVKRDGRDLLLANLLLQSRGLVEESKQRVMASLDARADEVIRTHTWAAGGATALNPIPLLDLAGGSAVTVKMVLDLAHVYRQSIDADTVVNLLGQLGKNLVAMLGVTAATPAVATGVASLLKTVPGIGTLAGGLVQGLAQALITRWIGRVFCEYFRREMKPTRTGLAEIARDKWQEVTQVDQLRRLVNAGREKLNG